jgi:hypothetical protein
LVLWDLIAVNLQFFVGDTTGFFFHEMREICDLAEVGSIVNHHSNQTWTSLRSCNAGKRRLKDKTKIDPDIGRPIKGQDRSNLVSNRSGPLFGQQLVGEYLAY